MDPLSAASNAFSVVSLAVELGDSINKLSIAEAPKEIASIIDQLRFFTQLLDDIQNNQKILGPDPTIRRAVERCEAPIKDLQQIADSLVPGFATSSNIRRKWTALATVRAKEKMARFQEQLHAAKTDLILARTLSADRAHQHYYQSYQESLVPVAEGLADIRNMLSYQSETITLRGQGERQFHEDISSEIQKAFASWPFHQFQSTLGAELRKGIDAAISQAIQRAGQMDPQLSNEIGHCHLDCATLHERYRKGRVSVSRSSTTKSLVFGEMHYRSTSYINNPKSTSILDMEKSISKDQLQVETSFSFVPSWWLTRFMTARAVKIDILSTRGWQANINSFNIVPRDSPIFEFCREGNLDAVKYLIGSRKASVNDMTEDGWTPLHVRVIHYYFKDSHLMQCSSPPVDPRPKHVLFFFRRALNRGYVIPHGVKGALPLPARVQVAIRACLLFSRTPFHYACSHTGFFREDEYPSGVVHPLTTSHSRLKETIREFLKAGEDFADAIDDSTICDLISGERGMDCVPSEMTSRWLLHDILPAINPTILDLRIWDQCLSAIIYSNFGHSLLPQILGRCDISMARTGIMMWIEEQDIDDRTFGNKWQNTKIRNFQLLVKMSGGLNFIHEYPPGTTKSPLFAAMRYPYSFSCFRVALQEVDIDIRELISFQIEMYPDGWTLERLLSLSQDPENAQPRKFWLLKPCKLCGRSVRHPDFEELAWKRRLDRFKHGVDPDAPLNEEEERQQKELGDAIVDFENGICIKCHEKKKTKKSTWSLFG